MSKASSGTTRRHYSFPSAPLAPNLSHPTLYHRAPRPVLTPTPTPTRHQQQHNVILVLARYVDLLQKTLLPSFLSVGSRYALFSDPPLPLPPLSPSTTTHTRTHAHTHARTPKTPTRYRTTRDADGGYEETRARSNVVTYIEERSAR